MRKFKQALTDAGFRTVLDNGPVLVMAQDSERVAGATTIVRWFHGVVDVFYEYGSSQQVVGAELDEETALEYLTRRK